MAKQTFAQWRDEDTDRLNKLAQLAHKMGLVVPVGDSLAPPELNDDGTLKESGPERKGQIIIGESGSEVPNYREATGAQRCDNCVFFTFPWCELYKFQAEADDVCDGWQPNPLIKKK